jgi:hypothetical protein
MHPHHARLAASLVLALGTTAVRRQQTSLVFAELAERPPAPERLVAEAVIREVGHGRHTIYLPVTINGHRGTIELYFASLYGDKIHLSIPALTQLGVDVSHARSAPPTPYARLAQGHAIFLDSLTVGTRVMRNVPVVTMQGTYSDQPDLPLVIGMAGNEFLEEYDIVVDGPARRIRLYARASQAAPVAPPALGTGLPPGVRAATCVPTQAMPEGHHGFPIQANGHQVIATMQTLFGGLTIMNVNAAKVLGLTQHSPNVHRVPDSLQTQAYQGVPNKYEAADIHLALGQYPFRDRPVSILSRVPLQPTVDTPSMELSLENLLDQVFVQSNSTGQVCLADPHPSTP